MKVVYEPELLAQPRFAEMARKSIPALEDGIGPASAERVTATWGFRIDEKGDPLIRLVIADLQWGEMATAEFTPEQLQKADRWPFSRLWWTVLTKAHERIQESLERSLVEEFGE